MFDEFQEVFHVSTDFHVAHRLVLYDAMAVNNEGGPGIPAAKLVSCVLDDSPIGPTYSVAWVRD